MVTRVAIACGGTGGHVYPALALDEWFDSCFSGVETSFFVSKSERCRKMMAGYGGRVRYIGGRGLPAAPSPASILFVLSLFRGLVLCLFSLARERPDVVVGMGGYGSAPLVLAGRLLGLPAVIHEQNLVPGRANAFLSRFADRTALSFPAVPAGIAEGKAVVTGNPVRMKIGGVAAEEARRRLGLAADRFTVLVMGGSRGARFLNELAVECAASLPREGFQWVHIAGEEDFEWVGGKYGEAGAVCHCAAFTDEMEIPYGAADVALCRAGATTIAELARCGLPAILVPYPHAVGEHQRLNAEYLAGRGAAVLLEQDEALPERVAAILRGLREDGEKLASMGRILGGIFERDAGRKLAETVLELAERGRK